MKIEGGDLTIVVIYKELDIVGIIFMYFYNLSEIKNWIRVFYYLNKKNRII